MLSILREQASVRELVSLSELELPVLTAYSPKVTAEPSASDISFVCCVEAGSLEAQTIRMVESLRRHGGRFANAPIYAVTPRPGPALSTATHAIFKANSVVHLKSDVHRKYNWFNFLNKPLALSIADAHMQTANAAWLDSDLLFVREPVQLALASGEDFTGFPVESKEMGTTGPGDPYEPLWQRCCEILKVDVERLPFQITAQTQERVRLYFNGGIFAYRRASGFASAYLDNCLRLLDSKVGTAARGYNLGFKEMGSIGFSVAQLGLSWRALEYSHNYVMLSSTHREWYSEEALKAAHVVHYHDSLWPSFWPTFIACLKRTHPETAAWLEPLGPMRNEAGLLARIETKLRGRYRARATRRYLDSCIAA